MYGSRLTRIGARYILHSNVKQIEKGHKNSTFTQVNSRLCNPETYTTTVEDCMPTFYNLVEELTERRNDHKEFSQRLKAILLYNVPRGKRVRVRTLMTAYKILEKPSNLTDTNLKLAYILGWCIEMLNSSILISDDIMDVSTQRRGAPCWYLVKNVGLKAISDARVLENTVFEVLKNHFRDRSCYPTIMEAFSKTSQMTYLGQSLDEMHLSSNKHLAFADLYTPEKYSALVKYKTMFYTLQLPMLLALNLSGQYSKHTYDQMQGVLLELSYFFQVQNDFWDCFADSDKTGKEGTDIQEGKCTWLIITALERSTPTQRKLLEQNYGKANPENIENVKVLYKELNIPNIFYEYKENIENIVSSYAKALHYFPKVLFSAVTDIVCNSQFKKVMLIKTERPYLEVEYLVRDACISAFTNKAIKTAMYNLNDR